jgi:hypothetical protein
MSVSQRRKASDVDGKGVNVHAVEVAFNDAQLQVVVFLRVVQFLAVEGTVDSDEFVEHRHQIGATAAGRVADFDVVKDADDVIGLGGRKVFHAVVLHEVFQDSFGQVGLLRQIML